LPNEEDLTSFPGSLKAVKKRVFNGVAWFVFQPDTMELYWQRDEDVSPVLVADFTLTAEVYHNSIWKSRQFSFEENGITRTTLQNGGVRFQAMEEDTVPFGTGLWGLRVFWEQGKVKFVFYADMPGLPIRLKWAIFFDESRKAQADEKGISWSIADYDGNIDSTVEEDDIREGWKTKTWTFEPDGHACPALDGGETLIQRYQAGKGLLVDPYLTIDEQSTYCDITCDGYVLRLYSGNTENKDRMYETDGSTVLCYLYNQIREEGGVTFSLSYDRDRILRVCEDTPTRVVIKKLGNFEDTDQNTLVNSTSLGYTYTIYPDRFSVRVEWVTSDTIDIDSSTSGNILTGIADNALTNSVNIAEISGVEKYHEEDDENDPDLVAVTMNTADYIGFKSDEVTMIGVELEHTDDSYYLQFLNQAGNIRFSWNNADTFPAGTHTMTCVWIVDSVEREGSAQIYNSTDRIAMGDQYKDDTIDQSPTDGDDVTDLVIPARIDTGTMHSDGAHHYTAANSADGVTDITMDISRIRPSFVVHEPVFHSGTVASPTDHLIEYIKADDNAASSTVVATIGDNATWESSEEAARNTDNESVSTDIRRRTGV